MKRETKILIGIFILALVLRLFFVYASPVKWWDETVYSNLGYDLSKNPFSYTLENKGWSDFIPGGEWPKIGFRAPLLPYFLALFYFLKLDFLIIFLMPLIGALSCILLYFLTKKMFNEKTALLSSIFLALIPIHVYYSSKILTDVFSLFLLIICFFVFWKAYEENNNKYKLIFGIVLALTLLSRYTSLYLFAVFFIYLLIRNRSLKFLNDRYLWYSAVLFLIVLLPFFIYGYFEYPNILGAFLHGFKASSYWGGVQEWYFFFKYWWNMFSILGFVLLFSIFYILFFKTYKNKSVQLISIWFLFFLFMAIFMGHKEERYILPIVPAICIFLGYSIERLKSSKILLFIIFVLLAFSLYSDFNHEFNIAHNDKDYCFNQALINLSSLNPNIIISDEPPLVYYVVHKKTSYYPNPWTTNLLDRYYNSSSYILFTDLDMPLSNENNIKIKKDLDENYDLIFNCMNRSFIYKIN